MCMKIALWVCVFLISSVVYDWWLWRVWHLWWRSGLLVTVQEGVDLKAVAVRKCVWIWWL